MILILLKGGGRGAGALIAAIAIPTLMIGYFFLRTAFKGRGDKRRVKAMELVAKQLGWSFTPLVLAKDFERSYTSTFHLTDKWNEKDIHIRFNNVMRTQVNDAVVTLFDYHYFQYIYRASISYEETIIHFRSPRLNLPDFFLHQNASRTGVAIGKALHIAKPDIDFSSNPEFSARYELRGHDEQAVRRVFNGAVLSFYEQTEGTTTNGFRNELIYYRSGKRVAPQNIRLFLDEAFRVLALFPNP